MSNPPRRVRYKMDSSITERRKTFVEILSQRGSMKIALKETSKKYGVANSALRTDWNRRSNWPKQIFENINNPIFTFQYMLEIRVALRQLENLIKKTTNPNYKLGAIRTKIDTLFKLVNLQRALDSENYLERIEKLERMAEKGVFIP